MGTRADFYVGKGRNAEWIGSVTHDGFIEGLPVSFFEITNEKLYREEIKKIINERNHPPISTGIAPSSGWPWPWKSSETTDCSYYFIDGRVCYLKKVYKWKKGKFKKYGRFFSLNTLTGTITKPIYVREEEEGQYLHQAYNIIGCGGLNNPNNIGNAGFMIIKIKENK